MTKNSGLLVINGGSIGTNSARNHNLDDDDEELQVQESPKLLPAGFEPDTEADDTLNERQYEDDYVDKNGIPKLLPPGIDPRKCMECDD